MTVPRGDHFFDVVIFDEASQIPLEEGQSVAIVLDGDSFLAKSAASLPSSLLAQHYRSRSEELIGFSNAASRAEPWPRFPDRHRPSDTLDSIRVLSSNNDGPQGVEALLDRNISFHFIEGAVYESRRNTAEAEYIAQLLRSLLERKTGMTIGITAFPKRNSPRSMPLLNASHKPTRHSTHA